jgi:hypothetical protein
MKYQPALPNKGTDEAKYQIPWWTTWMAVQKSSLTGTFDCGLPTPYFPIRLVYRFRYEHSATTLNRDINFCLKAPVGNYSSKSRTALTLPFVNRLDFRRVITFSVTDVRYPLSLTHRK